MMLSDKGQRKMWKIGQTRFYTLGATIILATRSHIPTPITTLMIILVFAVYLKIEQASYSLFTSFQMARSTIFCYISNIRFCYPPRYIIRV